MRNIVSTLYLFLVALKNYLVFKHFVFVPSNILRYLLVKYNVSELGKNVSFLMGIEIRVGKNIKIGSNCVFNRNVMLDGRGGNLTIKNNVDIGQETNIWTLEHDVDDNNHRSKGADVIIEDYVWIASRCTILPGVVIGEGAVVACNSVVTKDIAPYTVVGGIPAKYIKTRSKNLNYRLSHKPWFE